MSSPETSFQPGQENHIPFEPGVFDKPKVKRIKRADRQPNENDQSDEQSLAAAENDAWPKKGQLSTEGLLETRYAEKTFPVIDKLVDETFKLPVRRTMPNKKRPPDYTLSDEEKASLRDGERSSPANVKSRAKKRFGKLFGH